MPAEEEMVARDKYTVFDRKEKRYRKSIRSMSFFPFLALLFQESVWGCFWGREGRMGRGEYCLSPSFSAEEIGEMG